MSDISQEEYFYHDYYSGIMGTFNQDAIVKENLVWKSSFIISFLPVIIVIGIIGISVYHYHDPK